ncbi:CD2 protein, partial [Jacana jacana]|nr:CD2 protein [Jacana jacana]
WVKDRTKLLQMKNRSVKYYVNREQCRCKILPNGTLQIQQVAKEDSGKYKVTVFQQDGKLVAEEHKMVIVQGERNYLRCACLFSSFSEPVPQPILSADCRNKTIFVKCEVNQ